MRRCIAASFLLAICILSIQLMGCGDDDKGVDSTPQPSLNDPSYKVASSILETADAGVQLTYIWSLLEAYKVIYNDPNAPTYHASSGFWYRQEIQIDTIYSDTNPSVIINILRSVFQDSIRFWHRATPVQDPNPALLTRIEIGFHVWAAADSTIDSSEAMYEMNITALQGEFLDTDSGVVVMDGSGSMFGLIAQMNYSDSAAPNLDSLGVCEVQATIGTNYSALTMYLGDTFAGCPNSGTIISAGPIAVSYCPDIDGSLEFPATWNSTRTFNADGMTIVTKSPTRQWTKHETCGD